MWSRRQLSMLLALPVFLVMWVLYGWNYWSGDREGYELYYHTRDSLASWGAEVGYGYLNIIANQSGLSYQGFQILISLITLLLLARYLFKRTLSPFVSSVFYLLCFFSLDFVLMRNFLSFAICLQGFLVLFEGKSYYRVKYVVLILLAATFHQSALIFLVFSRMPLNRVVSLGRFALVFALFVFCYVLLRYALPLPDSIASHFNYYDTALKSSFANVFVHLVSVLLITLVVLVERKSLCKIECLSARERELSFIFNLNIISLFFLVLYFESEIFVRLLRSIVFFNLLHCVNSLFLPRRTYFPLVLYILIFSCYLVFFFIVPVAGYSIVPLFNNNLLLN